jgi:hypothetical protein
MWLLLFTSLLSSVLCYDQSLVSYCFDHAAASYSDVPSRCLSKYPSVTMVQRFNVSCDSLRDQAGSPFGCSLNQGQCWAFVSLSDRYITLAIRGTKTRLQLIAELVQTMSEPKRNWVAGGAIQRYFGRALDSLLPSIGPVMARLRRVGARFDKYPPALP